LTLYSVITAVSTINFLKVEHLMKDFIAITGTITLVAFVVFALIVIVCL
jgi:hypothetical protein